MDEKRPSRCSVCGGNRVSSEAGAAANEAQHLRDISDAQGAGALRADSLDEIHHRRRETGWKCHEDGAR